jgi:hypothetical protein
MNTQLLQQASVLDIDEQIEQHRIVVLAVFHGRRDPAIWVARA